MAPRNVEPEDLAQLLIERVNAGGLEDVVVLYEPETVRALPGERAVAGHNAIRRFYAELLATKPAFQPGEQLPALRLAHLALAAT